MPLSAPPVHRPPLLLAPRGLPALPCLAALPRAHRLSHGREAVAELARTLVRCRAVTRRDWDAGDPAPGGLVGRAVARTLRRLGHRTPQVLGVSAFLRPWSDVLDEVDARPGAGERRWALGLGCDQTHRLRMRPVTEALGETAAGVVADRLVRHTPLCTGDADDLEWILDGWGECGPDTGEEGRRIRARAEEGAALADRLRRLLYAGRSAPLEAVPPGPIRRQLAVLAALAARELPPDDAAWRETADVEWALPCPAVHLVWDAGCALSHALNEAEHLGAQDAWVPVPQQMWLLDPADPEGAARTWARWLHALRQTRATCRLLAALEALPGNPHPR